VFGLPVHAGQIQGVHEPRLQAVQREASVKPTIRFENGKWCLRYYVKPRAFDTFGASAEMRLWLASRAKYLFASPTFELALDHLYEAYRRNEVNLDPKLDLLLRAGETINMPEHWSEGIMR
jgi:hypothetical protein